jgi:hypothetical protein
MVLAQSFQHTTGRVADVFQALGFRPVPIPPTVVVQLPFDTFDEYLSSMRAQYRRRARRVFELSSHLRVERARGFVELAPELARLWRLVFDRAHELRREVLPSPFFQDIAAIEDTSLLVLRRPGGSIASYALLLEDDPCLHFLYTGFETRARDEGAYFRLLYEIVRTAIDRGFTQANLGLTTLEPKLDVGGVPVPLYAWLHHHREPVGRLLAHLGSGVFAPDPARPRSVFKA